MKEIEEYREKINFVLREFLEEKLKKDGKYSQETKKLIENIIEFNLRGGKRIRPLAMIFAYKCFKDDENILKASICMELMQAYLLIHDDIIDNAELRRGKPSMHMLYGGGSFGNSIAILAGNLCASYVYDSIIESDFSDEDKIEAIKHISWVNSRENYGQALDLLPGFDKLSENEIMQIYELKTATYTLQGPLYLGASLGQSSKADMEKLQKYAYNVGIAFQIQDDINGVFGNVEETGKPNDSDVKEGKKTLLIVKTLELCNKNDKKFILETYGNQNIDEKSMERIREIMKECGAFDYCKNKMNDMIDEGKNSIAGLDLNEKGKNFLINLGDYIKNL